LLIIFASEYASKKLPEEMKFTNNYRVITLISDSSKTVSNLILPRSRRQVEQVVRDHQCEFQRNISASDSGFYIRQTLEEKWNYNEIVLQRFREFKKSYDWDRSDVLYSIPIEFGVPMKLVRHIKVYRNESYSEVHIGQSYQTRLLLKII
jgi:hypothetical protein